LNWARKIEEVGSVAGGKTQEGRRLKVGGSKGVRRGGEEGIVRQVSKAGRGGVWDGGGGRRQRGAGGGEE